MDVLIVDDHPIVLETLRTVVNKAVTGASVSTAKDLASGVSCARRLKKLGFVLLDLGLPDCTGVEALLRFRKLFPRIRVAVVSANEGRSSILDSLRAGAAGFIPKTLPPLIMVAAVRLIAEGGIYIPREAVEISPEPASPTRRKRAGKNLQGIGLTGRQTGVLRLLVRGLANRQIAEQLSIAENTVKKHTHAVFQALGVSSRAEAMVAAARLGMEFV